MKKRLPVFDLIRSVAIITILLHHLPNYTFNFYNLKYFGIPLNLSILNELSGYFGLALFIFMSGYLLNARKAYFSNWGEVRRFGVRKLTRIVPLYYLALIMFSFTEHVHNPLKLLTHALGLQLLLRTETHAIPIRTLWFVGLITIYYSVFAVVKNNSLDKRLRGGILVSSWILPLILNGYFSVTDYRISLYWLIFWFGILCAEKNLPNQRIWRYVSQASAVLFVATTIWVDTEYKPLIGSESTFVLKYVILNVLMLSFVITAYNFCKWLSRRLAFQSGLKFTAYISYCMYLFHRPVWYVMKNLLVNQFSVDGAYTTLMILVVFGLPIIFGLSYGLQSIYDRYFRQYLLSALKMA